MGFFTRGWRLPVSQLLRANFTHQTDGYLSTIPLLQKLYDLQVELFGGWSTETVGGFSPSLAELKHFDGFPLEFF